MNLISDKSTIVLAGAFNPAILTPTWIAQNVMGYPAGQQFQVEMLAPVPGFGGLQRFTFDGFSYSPSYQSLTFFLRGLDRGGRERVVTNIARILNTLPHTPTSGLGFNFAFSVSEPGAELLDLLRPCVTMAEAFPDGAEIVSRGWANTLTWNEAIVTVQAQLDGGQVNIDANFHYGVASAAEASRVLEVADAYESHLTACISAVEALAQQRLEAQ